MRANAPALFGERAGRLAHRAASKHDGARGEGAKSVGPHRRVAVADRDLSGVDAELMRRDLRQRGLVPLPVVLHTHKEEHTAVRQHACIGGFVSGYDTKLAFGEFHDAVTALLRVESKPDADPAPVRLACGLALAYAREYDLLSRYVEAGNIITGVELHAGRCPVGKLRGCHD